MRCWKTSSSRCRRSGVAGSCRCSSVAARRVCSRARAIDRLLAGIRARVPLTPGAEVTLEANPGTFEREKFAGYRAAGVNRLSLGIQSFDPEQLAVLGRVHGADEARRAAEAALAIFDSVNFDLMYALPRQTVAEAEADVAAGTGLRATAPVVLSADARAEYAVPPPSAPATRRRHDGGHRGGPARCARDGRIPALRDFRVRARRTRVPPQPELLAVRRLPRHRRRRALEALVRRSHRQAGTLPTAEAVHGTGHRGRAAAGRQPRWAR